MQLQMKQMQSLTKQFSSHIGHSNINFDPCDVITQHTQSTRCRSHDNEEDNSSESDKHYKDDVVRD